jgi:hypothetical protein
MSLIGALRYFLPEVLVEGREYGAAHNDAVVETGDLARLTNRGHECHMFRWSELSALLTPFGEIVGSSAANFLTAQHDDALEAATDAERNQVLNWELDLCREPGVLDGGTHMLAAIRTPPDQQAPDNGTPIEASRSPRARR